MVASQPIYLPLGVLRISAHCRPLLSSGVAWTILMWIHTKNVQLVVWGRCDAPSGVFEIYGFYHLRESAKVSPIFGRADTHACINH